MVIGGQAVLLHGEPRFTRDIDITLGADLDALPRVLAATRELGLVPLVDPEDFTRDTMVLPCRSSGGVRVDLIFSYTPYERAAISRSVVVPLAGIGVRFACAEDLIVHKMIAGRPRDLDDVRSVLLRNPMLDRNLVRTVLTEFQSALAQPVLERFDRLAHDLDQSA
jgi:hypothetical protein